MYQGIALWIMKCDPLAGADCEQNETRVENLLKTVMFKVYHVNEVVDYSVYGRKPVRNQLQVSNFFQVSVNSFGYYENKMRLNTFQSYDDVVQLG